MNENKKLYILIAIIVAVILLIIGLDIYNSKKNQKTLKDFNTAYESESVKMIVIGRDSCGYCQYYTPYVNYMKEQYGFEYLYINTDKITASALSEVLTTLKIDESKFGTPHTVFVQNKSVVKEISGFVDEKTLFSELKSVGFIGKEEELPLNYIDLAGFVKKAKSKKNQVIVIGRANCGYCISTKPTLLTIAKKYDVEINYFDVTEIEQDESKMSEVYAALPYLKDNELQTPVMLIVKAGKVINKNLGNVSEEEYVKFLKENQIID